MHMHFDYDGVHDALDLPLLQLELVLLGQLVLVQPGEAHVNSFLDRVLVSFLEDIL